MRVGIPILFSLILVAALAQAKDEPKGSPAAGEWHVLMEFRGQEHTAIITLRPGEGGVLIGVYRDGEGRSTPLTDLAYSGGKLSFRRKAGGRTIAFEGTIEGGTLSGHHRLGEMRIPVNGRRGKQAFDAYLAARRKANERTGDLEADYDKHARRVVKRDGFPVLFDPPMMSVATEKGVLDDEPVIGVAIGGEAKAYPIAIMGIHELVNDTCGGRPILTSW